jgi:hypothetical protein
MAINVQTHAFVVPEKKVKQPSDIELWEKSEVCAHSASFNILISINSFSVFKAYRDLLGFICAMNDAVRNKKLTDECHVSEVMHKNISLDLSLYLFWIVICFFFFYGGGGRIKKYKALFTMHLI